MERVNLYQAELMEHYRHSPFRGTFQNPTITAHDLNPSCGDRITIYLDITNDVVTRMRFEGAGCVLSQASASMLAEVVEGKSLNAVRSFSKDDMVSMLGLNVGPNRLKCVLLGLDVLHQGIISYNKEG